MKTYPHAASGCNYPESECAGLSTVIRDARLKAGLTKAQAAALCHVNLRTWYRWETGEYPMPAASWELFTLLTDPAIPALLKPQAA